MGLSGWEFEYDREQALRDEMIALRELFAKPIDGDCYDDAQAANQEGE